MPTLLLFNNKKFNLIGVDNNYKVLKSIKQPNNLQLEKSIKKLLVSKIKNKSFELSTKIKKSDIYIICVPTPHKIIKKIGKPDLRILFSVIKKIKKIIKNNDIIIIESTIPVGTINLINNILQYKKNIKINIGYCPERVLPGNILKELIYNNRIVGGINLESAKHIKEIYKSFSKGEINITDSKTAEMSKLIENAYRDVNIAFSNEISMIAKRKNVNINNVIKLANKHPRVNILKPGIGVGGHCIPVDPWFLIYDNIKETKLLQLSRKINDDTPDLIVKDILF